MKLLEVEAKKVLQNFGLKVPAGIMLSEANINSGNIPIFSSDDYVLKAQVLSGGRGKSGGIKFASGPELARKTAKEMLGKKLITKQNPEGEIIKKVLVEEKIAIEKEFYIGLVLDRDIGKPVLIVSQSGGIDIEETAEKEPEKSQKIVIEPLIGLQDFQVRNAADFLGFSSQNRREFSEICKTLFTIFREKDLLILEINPLALTAAKEFVCLDAKIIVDDYALFRQPEFSEIAKERESGEENEIKKAGLNYHEISEEEGVGVFSNGAGLLLDTLDRIEKIKANTRSSLDLGGTITTEQICLTLKVMNDDPKIKFVFGNIFTALTGTKKISDAVLEFLATKQLKKPFVLRLTGREAGESIEILEKEKIQDLYIFQTTEEALACLKNIIKGEKK